MSRAESVDNVDEMVSSLVMAGHTPVICIDPPRSPTPVGLGSSNIISDVQDGIRRNVAADLRRMAAEHRIPLIDFDELYARTPWADWTTDNLHPHARASYAGGAEIARVIRAIDGLTDDEIGQPGYGPNLLAGVNPDCCLMTAAEPRCSTASWLISGPSRRPAPGRTGRLPCSTRNPFPSATICSDAAMKCSACRFPGWAPNTPTGSPWNDSLIIIESTPVAVAAGVTIEAGASLDWEGAVGCIRFAVQLRCSSPSLSFAVNDYAGVDLAQDGLPARARMRATTLPLLTPSAINVSLRVLIGFAPNVPIDGIFRFFQPWIAQVPA